MSHEKEPVVGAPAGPSGGETLSDVAAAIAAQIGMEQKLVAARLTWNLTFQGFLITSYAVVAVAGASDPARQLIHYTIIAAGSAVCTATLFGIWAAGKKSKEIKTYWTEDLRRSPYPRPFSEKGLSLCGRLPAWAICLSILGMWIALGRATYIESGTATGGMTGTFAQGALKELLSSGDLVGVTQDAGRPGGNATLTVVVRRRGAGISEALPATMPDQTR